MNRKCNTSPLIGDARRYPNPRVCRGGPDHTSAAFTLDVYSDVLPHMQDDAAAKVEAALIGS